MVTTSVFVVVNHATQPSTPPLFRTILVKFREVEVGVAEVALGLIALWINLTGASATGKLVARLVQLVVAMLFGPVRRTFGPLRENCNGELTATAEAGV